MTANIRKYLRVNLSNRKTQVEPIDHQIAVDLVGGRGFGAYYLYRELKPHVEPLSEDNKLLFVTGPLAGTGALSTSRWMVCTRSPLTNCYARSVCGADFGAWLKFCGYDFIIVEGKAEKPVYIHLDGENCQINDASDLWGKDTKQTQELLTQRHGDTTRVACIGQAGEKLVKYAAVVSDRRTAGRCGTGTVMGFKNLKAIAINARRNPQLQDPTLFRQLIKEQVAALQASKGFHHHTEYGTTDTQNVTNNLGIYPVKNFRYGKQNNYLNIGGEEYKKFRTGDVGCYACPVRCAKRHEVTQGAYRGTVSDGPEYESIWAFTATIDSLNIEATIAADQLCDDYGIDTISAGSSIGFAYELYEKGILTSKDTDGLELTYGNHQAMIALIKKIAFREGIGNMLAEGSRRAAEIIGKGAEKYAIHVKGLELPAYEPRGAKSQGYNYVTSNIGASHVYGYSGQDIFGAPVPRPTNRFAEVENADIVIYNQNNAAKSETGVACGFSGGWGWIPDIFSRMLAAATGIDQLTDLEHLAQVGERIINLERSFNVRNGIKREYDTFPVRLLTEPLRDNETSDETGRITSQNEFLDRYYQLRGWTKEGVPSPEKLSELNLGYIKKDIK
jgi:aldehyde:ferredoxin oxidoreductase